MFRFSVLIQCSDSVFIFSVQPLNSYPERYFCWLQYFDDSSYFKAAMIPTFLLVIFCHVSRHFSWRTQTVTCVYNFDEACADKDSHSLNCPEFLTGELRWMGVNINWNVFSIWNTNSNGYGAWSETERVWEKERKKLQPPDILLLRWRRNASFIANGCSRCFWLNLQMEIHTRWIPPRRPSLPSYSQKCPHPFSEKIRSIFFLIPQRERERENKRGKGEELGGRRE